MIKIDRYYNDVLKGIETELEGVDSVVFSPTEKHLIKKISKSSGVVLAASYPTATGSSFDVDNVSDVNRCLIFVLQKVNEGDLDELNGEVDVFKEMQVLVLAVKSFFIAELRAGNELLSGLDVKSFKVEPEFQIYGGFSGYSMSFDVKDFD